MKNNYEEVQASFNQLPIRVDTRPKLNVHKAFAWCPGRNINVLSTFNLGSASTGIALENLQTTFFLEHLSIVRD